MKKLIMCLIVVLSVGIVVYAIAGHNNQAWNPGHWTPMSQFAAIAVFYLITLIAILGIVITPKDQL
jgi:hypothetical protein